MRRVLPYPLLFCALLAMWLLLQQSAGLGHLLLGSLIAWGATHSMAALQPERPRVRGIGKIIRLVLLVIADVARSNLHVSLLILTGKRGEVTSGFLRLPLELTDKIGLAILACIVTATPGSAWLEYDPLEDRVLIHVLDLVDEEAWIKQIKSRYETLLLEIFQ